MHCFDESTLLRADVRWDVGGAVLAASGDLDTHSAPRFRAVLEQIIGRAPRRIVVDLAGVTFFSCAAVTVLQDARRDYPGQLRLVAASRPVRRIMDILQLDAHLCPAIEA